MGLDRTMGDELYFSLMKQVFENPQNTHPSWTLTIFILIKVKANVTQGFCAGIMLVSYLSTIVTITIPILQIVN